MNPTNKLFLIIIFSGFLFMFAKDTCASSQGMVELKFENNFISAKLSNATLKSILDMISEEKGIWYQGDEKSLNEKITLYFVNLTLYDGLRKILSKTNYALVYDIKKEIVGIFITSKSASIENVLKRDIQYTGSNFPRLDNETEEVSKIIHSEEINLEEKREIVVDKVNQTEKTANSELSIRPDDYEGE